MASPSALLKVDKVSKRYESPGGGQGLAILDNVSLEVAAGESVAIMGPSGSGKSTLLQIIGTLDHPTSGEVLLAGRNLHSLDERQLAEVRNSELGFVFQAHHLLPQCTVLENVLIPTLAGTKGNATASQKGNGLDSGKVKNAEKTEVRASRLLNRVGLGERVNHRPGELSGGERQRVAVVRALINEPLLLLADEPTGSLDHASAQELGKLLVELNREEKITLIVVTHSPELADRMGQVRRLQDGRLA
jgi:ABC-type lipoprotein export system ATPase subunit